MAFSQSLIKVNPALQWKDHSVFVIKEFELFSAPTISLNRLEDMKKPCILAVDKIGVCWMPIDTPRKDRLLYASTLPLLKTHFDLEKIKTVYSQEEFDDLVSSIRQPVDRRLLMSNDELIREDLIRRQEDEREELIKQHAENKITEAAKSGGFHAVKPVMTQRAVASLQAFKTQPPSLPSIGKWIHIQLEFGDAETVLDIPVTKSIHLEQPFPIDKTETGVYFLSFLRNEKIVSGTKSKGCDLCVGQITWYPVGLSPKVKMMYASVISAVKKDVGKMDYTLVIDDGREVELPEIVDLLPEPVSFVPSSPTKAGFKKPQKPKMLSKSTFISPIGIAGKPTPFSMLSMKSPTTFVQKLSHSPTSPQPKTLETDQSTPKITITEHSPNGISPKTEQVSHIVTEELTVDLKPVLADKKDFMESFTPSPSPSPSPSPEPIKVQDSTNLFPSANLKPSTARPKSAIHVKSSYEETSHRPLSEQLFAKTRLKTSSKLESTSTINKEEDSLEDSVETKSLVGSYASEATLDSYFTASNY